MSTRPLLHALLFSALSVFLLASCAEEDTMAPPPPNLDPLQSPTSLEVITVTGTAEYGSTVLIVGGVAPVEVISDYFTARFRAEVSLNINTDNVLTVTATDDAGNVSEPATVTVTHEAASPDRLMLSLLTPIVSADAGTLRAVAVVENDETGVPLGGLGLVFSVADYDGVADLTVQTDDLGRAEVLFEGLHMAGSGTLSVTAVDNAALSRRADFVVVGGAAAEVTVLLATDTIAPAEDITGLLPDTAVTVTMTAADAWQNPIDAPLVIVTNAPDAFVEGNVIKAVTTAGTWTVAANVLGTSLSDSTTMTFIAGPPTEVSFELNQAAVQAGMPVTATASATDAWGNEVPAETFTISVVEVVTSPATPVVDDTVTIEAPAGSYTVVATLDSDSTVTAQTTLEVFPGAPDATSFIFNLLATDVTTGAPLDVRAGTDVGFEYFVSDSFGNAIAPADVQVNINAFGAVVANDGMAGGIISQLTVTGLYTVFANVRGSTVSASVPLEVTPAAANRIDLAAATNMAEVGMPVALFFQVTDVYGNVLPAATIEVATNDATAVFSGNPAAAVDADTFTFNTPGTWTVAATVANSTIADMVYVAVSQVIDFEPPTVVVTRPTAGANVADGSPIMLTIDASDAGGLLEVGYTTTGTITTSGLVLIPNGTTATTQSFTLLVPNGAYGSITIYAYARDEAGNQTNATPVTIYSQLPASSSFQCAGCASFTTIAAGYDEGGVFPNGNEGGIRDPREIAVGSSGEIYVAQFTNVRLQNDSGFIGTNEIDQYIALVLPDGSVEPFATHEDANGVADQAVIGLAFDDASGTLYASLGYDVTGNTVSRIVAFTPSGIQDYNNASGFREQGLGFVDNTVLAVDTNPDPDRVYSVDPGPTVTTIFNAAGNNGMFDVCGGGGAIYVTRNSQVWTCGFSAGTPSSCANPVLLSDDPDLAASGGVLRSCEVSPSGMVIVTNRDDGTVISIDPAGTANDNAWVLISGMNQPIGVAFDLTKTPADLIVSDAALNGVFRFSGSF